MRRAVRLAVFCLTAAVLCGLLSGCHGSRERAVFETPGAFDETVGREVVFWAKNDTNKAQTRVYEQAISEFQALYPSVRITMRLYTDYSRIYNDVITNIATDTTPDVCVTYPDHIATYKTGSNVVVALDSLMADERYGLGGSELRFDGPAKDEIIPQFLDECMLDGACYALPYMRSTEACYVNKTFVEALGYELPDVLTWDFVWEVADKAAEKDADGVYLLNGQKTMIPFIYKSTDNMMIQLLRQSGAGYSTSDGQIEIFNDRTREILNDVAAHTASGAFGTFKIVGYPANFLNAGQCVFAIDSTAGSTWMGTDAPLVDISPENIVEFETAVRPIPQLDPEHPQMISQGPSLCLFNKKDEQQVLASWLFMQYLLTDGIQVGYARTEGYVPVTDKAQSSEAYRDYVSRAGEDTNAYYSVKLEASRLLTENVGNTFVTPVFNGSASLRDAAGQLIEETTKAVRRKKTTDDAFYANLFDSVTSLYRLDQAAGANGGGRQALGELPAMSKGLLAGLAIVWLLLGVYALRGVFLRKKG